MIGASKHRFKLLSNFLASLCFVFHNWNISITSYVVKGY